MKKITLITLLLVSIIFAGCSPGASSTTAPVVQTFTIDGKTFNVIQQADAITELRKTNLMIGNVSYTRSSVSLVGLYGKSETGTISFDLYYKTGQTIAGTYTIHDQEAVNAPSFDVFLSPLQRGCSGWTTSTGISAVGGTGFLVSANNPKNASVVITANTATNYTIYFTGNFGERNVSNGAFIRNVPVFVNVTGDVMVQSY